MNNVCTAKRLSWLYPRFRLRHVDAHKRRSVSDLTLQEKACYFIVLITHLISQGTHHDRRPSLTLPGARSRALFIIVAVSVRMDIASSARELSLMHTRLLMLDRNSRTPLPNELKVFNGLNMANNIPMSQRRLPHRELGRLGTSLHKSTKFDIGCTTSFDT